MAIWAYRIGDCPDQPVVDSLDAIAAVHTSSLRGLDVTAHGLRSAPQRAAIVR
ncbi:MAG: hypothetical protein WA944_07100 [Mycobacterium sp.]